MVALELDGPASVEAAPLQQPDSSIELLAGMADLHVPKRGSRIEVHPGGVIANWYNKANWMSWKFKVVDPGEFDVKVVTGTLRHYGVWEGGHRIRVSVGGSSVSGATTADEQTGGARASYFPEHVTNLGRITIEGDRNARVEGPGRGDQQVGAGWRRLGFGPAAASLTRAG